MKITLPGKAVKVAVTTKHKDYNHYKIGSPKIIIIIILISNKLYPKIITIKQHQ